MTVPATRPAAGLRLGVIGVGRMGLRHLEVAKRLGMVPCAIADAKPEALEQACQEVGSERPSCFVDGADMLRTVALDAVVVATTAPTHADYVGLAADAGVPYILCEKPMATSLTQADGMIRACKRGKARLAINHQMRFMPQYSDIAKLIDSDELGPLVSVLVAGSNFGLAMNASHYFEMFKFVSGARVRNIQAWFEGEILANPRGDSFEDRSGRIIAWGENGQPMYIDFSAAAGFGLQCTYICRNGQITVDELSGDVRVAARQAEYREYPTSRYGLPASIRQFSIPPADTVVPTMSVWQAMLGGESFPNGDDGRHALACLVAAHVSHREGGRAVEIDGSSLPRDQVFGWA